jgi:hypothetical protein
MSSQTNGLVMNVRKVVMSYATIQNGRIVIPNGMVTLEHYTDSINMNRVRVRETNSVNTVERSPRVIKLHSRANKTPDDLTLQVVWKIVLALLTPKNAIKLRYPSVCKTSRSKPAVSHSLDVHHGNTNPLFGRNGLQRSADILNVYAGLRHSDLKSEVTDPPHKQIVPMRVATQTMWANELNVFALQPSERLIPIAGTHGVGCSSEIARAHGQPSTFLGLADIKTEGGSPNQE